MSEKACETWDASIPEHKKNMFLSLLTLTRGVSELLGSHNEQHVSEKSETSEFNFG